MKWLLVIGGVLLALVIIVFAVGAMLPRDHVAGSSVVLHQPADTVWRVVRDMAGVTAWWSDVTSSQRVADSAGREVWEQKLKNGFSMRLIVTDDAPPRRLVTTIDAPPDAPFGGTWTYEVSAAEGGARVAVTEAGYVNNPLFRFMSRFVFGHHATQDGYLKALGKHFGETVQPMHHP
jgi:uncharacterized protein YndB with AHSA1/START domain